MTKASCPPGFSQCAIPLTDRKHVVAKLHHSSPTLTVLRVVALSVFLKEEATSA